MGRKKRNSLTYETLPALFKGICDSIRSKTGEVGTINHQDIPAKIAAIETGGDTIVGINEVFTVPAYGSGSKSYTVEKDGTLNIMAVGNGVGENQLSITKNGAGVSEYVSFKNNTGSACIRSASISVTTGDVVSANYTTASLACPAMVLAILTPTS